MVSLSCRHRRQNGVTLVELLVANGDDPRRVRIDSRLDGPVWPPRQRGVPARGWDEDGFEGVLAPGEYRTLGYATPARPADPPATVAWTEPVDDDSAPSSPAVPDVEPSPAGVVRALGDPRPPRDAVPDPESPPNRPLDADASGCRGTPSPPDQRTPSPSGRGTPSPPDRRPDLPAAVGRWLDGVERRLADAERLADATTLAAATRELERADGLDGARRLARALERDRRAMARVADRIEALADRADGLSVPVGTFERLS
ncbi:hypothetical protein BRC83_06635 [Halobacteriales archaeon QS_1_68_17]|nr:MAG: hypothetical protein BRC83_06635 [Halobacteriales archaeon QS_1_68_17]